MPYICKWTHRQVQYIGQLRQPIEHQGDERKSHVRAQDAKGGNGGKVAEELLLLD